MITATVTINAGLNNISLENIQRLEISLDAALAPNGFTRVNTSKMGNELVYQYDKTLNGTPS